MEIVKLIGSDVLPDSQKLILEISKVIRNGFLQQNAYHPSDTFVPMKKQFLMMDTILHLKNCAKKVIAKNIPISQLIATGIFDEVVSIKYTISNDALEKFDDYKRKIDEVCDNLLAKNEVKRWI